MEFLNRVRERERGKEAMNMVGERKRETETPPIDDCCPICFGTFTFPCRSNCDHWFCANCILQFWRYSAALQPCKCPMCCRRINRLTPEASLHHRKELEVTEVLENVQRYNRLFVGGIHGVIQKVLELPLLIGRMFREIMDPDRTEYYYYKVRIFAMVLGALYMVSPFDFIPTGGVAPVRLFDYFAIVLVCILHLVGLYRRRRLTQRVRHLAASQT